MEFESQPVIPPVLYRTLSKEDDEDSSLKNLPFHARIVVSRSSASTLENLKLRLSEKEETINPA